MGVQARARRALVTGASGFIGAHLAAALTAHGYRVRALVRPTSNIERLTPLDVEIVHGDVTQLDSLARAVAGCDLVLHLAGLTKAFSMNELLAVNQRGSENLSAVCARQPNPPVLVSVSSLAAAGPSLTGQPRLETEAAAPVSRYGLSKRLGELAAEAWAAEVPTTILRPPIVFGEGDSAMLQMFRPIASFGVHVTPTFFPRRFSLIHAADLAEAIVLAAERGQRLPPPGDAATAQQRGYYYLADEEQPSYPTLGRMIGRALGRPWTLVVRLPSGATWVNAALVETWCRLRGRPSILSIDKIREATAGSWICSNQRAEQELGFRTACSLDQRLRETAHWYQEQGWLKGARHVALTFDQLPANR